MLVNFPLVALSDFQRTEIALRYEEVIKKKAKERQLSGLKKGQNVPLVSMEHNGENHKTRDEIAKIAGTSGATVMRTKFILENGTDEQKERATVMRTGRGVYLQNIRSYSL